MSEKEEKGLKPLPNGAGGDNIEDALSDSASRARNKTVMLTPEVTGQIRDMLGGGELPSGLDPLTKMLPGGTSTAVAAKPAEGDWQKPGGNLSPSQGPAPVGLPPTVAATGIPRVDAASMRGKTTVISRPPSPVPAPPIAAPVGATPVQREGLEGMKTAQAAPATKPAVSVNPRAVQASSAGGVVSSVGKSKIVGFFISFDDNEYGEVFQLRKGRWLLTSRPAGQEDYILIVDESVSALHAIIRASDDGKIQILDQLSEHGTKVRKLGSKVDEDVSGSMVTVEHGDQIRFGKRNFTVCMVPKTDGSGNQKSAEVKKSD